VLAELSHEVAKGNAGVPYCRYDTIQCITPMRHLAWVLQQARALLSALCASSG
jgi:hypothetical protein